MLVLYKKTLGNPIKQGSDDFRYSYAPFHDYLKWHHYERRILGGERASYFPSNGDLDGGPHQKNDFDEFNFETVWLWTWKKIKSNLIL